MPQRKRLRQSMEKLTYNKNLGLKLEALLRLLFTVMPNFNDSIFTVVKQQYC